MLSSFSCHRILGLATVSSASTVSPLYQLEGLQFSRLSMQEHWRADITTRKHA